MRIQQLIDLRPLAPFGNSDGDLRMLRWTAAGPRPRLMLLIHHTDTERRAKGLGDMSPDLRCRAALEHGPQAMDVSG